MFGMRFASPKSKMMLQDCVGVTPNLSIKGQFTERVDKFTYLGSCITPDGSIAEELSSCIQKVQLAFSNLHHLWRRNDVKLSTKGRIYSAAVRSVLLYGSETWPLKAEDIRRLSVFDHRCLRSIGKIWWEHRISNTEVRRRVLGPRNMSMSLSSCIIIDFGGWDMYCACRTTVFPGEPCSPNPKVAGKGPPVVSIWPGKGTWNP